MRKKPLLRSETVYDKMGNILFRVHYETNKGDCIEKTVSFDSYLQILSASAIRKETLARIGRLEQLPRYYYDGSISATQKDSFDVILKIPAAQRVLIYGGRHWHIPMPALLFFFSVREGSIKRQECYALATDTTDSDTALYLYPFGNVSTQSRICFGNITLPKLNGLSDIDMVVDAFLSSETNNDYYYDSDDIALNNSGKKQGDLLQYLQGKKKFPLQYLKAVVACGDAVLRVNDLLKRL